MTLVSDQDYAAALGHVPADLQMNLGHERAGRVDDFQTPRFRLFEYGRRHAVGTEDDHAVRRDLVQLLYEHHPALPEPVDHGPVVHDFAPDIER